MSNNQSAETIPDPSWKYDVYLSFQGQETRDGFISNLYKAFKNAGIRAFIDDDEELRSSEDQITNTVVQEIEGSRVSVVVLSQGYASSRWCLDQLTKIMECRSSKRQIVIPVFYNVGPEDVRHQRGPFEKDFQSHMNRFADESEKVRTWRGALTEAANIAGFEIIRNRNDEIEMIGHMVKHITTLLAPEDLFFIKHPVGLKSRAENVIQLLNYCQIKENDVVMIGIWGMGGLGKTTIAKAVYNQIRHDFDSAMFLPDIREMWDKNRQVLLREQLLNGLCKELGGINIQNTVSGIAMLEERLRRKRVFIVLDDVAEIGQLNALCGSREWFGPGSKIIITTRDKHLLSVIGVDHVYQLKEMDKSESLELLCWNAFAQATPFTEFARLTQDAVTYCRGLPLALLTLGCQLFGKMIDEWRIVLDGLKRMPHRDVFEVLKISYGGLNDTEKQIFLDIAWFCVGMERRELLQTTNNAFPLSNAAAISILEERSLITFDEKDRVRMHDLLRDMGKQIVHESQIELQQPRIYDVFLSFRGKDTRPTFTSHLHTSLQNAAITVFKDDDDVDGLQRGEQISAALVKAIESSACSIIIFSTHYADSRWCLKELEDIMLRHRKSRQVVFPVFYGVDPSDVRYQKKESDFGKAFESLISRRSVEEYQVESWRANLREVSNLSGMSVVNSRNEAEDIKRIVEHVTRLLDKTELFVAAHPVGVTSRVEKVIKELNIQQTEDVVILGINGMGGTGKTTIAKAIYNQIRHNFEGRSFLLKIRETWQQDNGKVYLQQRLLEDIFRATRKQIHNIDSGKQTLMESLGAKRVLIVLDDVNNLDQLNALCGGREWFGPGSIVIITTRDDHLLRLCEVDHTFEIEEMDDKESLELFSWHAFKQASPKDGFVEVSTEVVKYSKRLPLALEVLGSYLFDRGIKEWNSALGRLPNKDVLEILQISYDGLREDYEKEAFLDIACFFIGMDRNDVVHILNGCRIPAEIAISVLKERSLITVDNNNVLGMHELLQDMARAIICKESLEPENRSRLWYDETVLELLENLEGTDLKVVKGLSLKLPSTNSIGLSKEAFKNMTKLKLLQLSGVQVNGNNGQLKHLSRYLRWMSWHGFPLTHTTTGYYQPNIVSIELENSKLKVLWKEARMLTQLKILNLSHSHDLIKTPDFSHLPNLEKLVLKDCTELSSISHTIGSLEKILLINIEDCTNLCVLPRSIYKLTSLETLILSGCSKIEKLEEDVAQMKSLAVLKADNTAIVQVPTGLARLRNLAHCSLCGYEGSAPDVISLIMFWLWTSPNNMLSSVMQKCSSAVSTYANCGPRPQIKGNVSLDISESKSSLNSLLIQMGMDNSVTELLQKTISQNNELGDYLISCDNHNPSLLTISGEGCFVTFQVLQMNGRNLKSMMLRIIYYSSSTFLTTTEGLILENVEILNLTKDRSNVYEGDKLTSFKDEDREILISSLEPGDTVRVVVALVSGFIVKNTIVYLIYDDEPPTVEISEHCNDDKDDIVSSVGGILVADVNEGAFSVDVIAKDNDEDVTAFSVHDAVTGPNEIVSGVDAMEEDKDDVTVIGDENVSNNLYVAAVVERQLVEAISTTKTFESKSEGLIPLVQAPFGSITDSELTLTKETVEKTQESIRISQSVTDLSVNPTSPVTAIMPVMVAEGDELHEDIDLLIAELDKTLSESNILLYPTSGSSEDQSLPVISIFQKMKLLLDNELETLVEDGDIKKQVLHYLAQLGQIMESSQVPKDFQSLVIEIRHFYEDLLNDFPSVQEELDSHKKLIDLKNGIQEKLAADKAKKGELFASIAKGKEKVHELDVQLKALYEYRNKLQSTVERCEVQSVNINRKLETSVKENEEVVNTLKESESAFKKAEVSKKSYERKLAVLKRALVGNTRH